MKTQILLMVMIIGMISCSKEGSRMEPNNDPNDDQKITAAQYADLPRPCLMDASFMQLPTPITLESNYTQYDYTTSLVSGISTIKLQISNLANSTYPPSDALVAPIDDINVFDGDEAYYWITGGDKYLYRRNDAAYSIYSYRTLNSITAAESIYVDQDEDCEHFTYIDYVVGDDPNTGKGQLRISYDLAGTAHIIEMETDTWTANYLRENYRFFEDGSGEYTQHIGGDISLRVFWESNSSGNYIYFENGLEVDSGTFSF